MATAPTPTLLLQGLSKHFAEKKALTDLNLEVQAGEIYCLLGHNGAGKTTTVNLLLNFLAPSAGKIIIAGLDLNQNPREALRQVAYIPELVMLYPELNALENLAYFSELAGHHYQSTQLESFLSRAGLPQEAFKRPVGKYSKGMRQKVGIAIALAKQARLLVLDEPTSGLDPHASYEFSTCLKELAAEQVAIFMVTHDLFRVRELNARVGILKLGQLQRELQAGELEPAELEKLYLAVAH